ncbi:MAG TPA: MaoC/PaaZ C-terminal domain-containing protein [Dehalococcoidia bacterium]|nr:MaoC/PaaZ C-terminal domain-containing protein [Dehalococcoidia bacterium]
MAEQVYWDDVKEGDEIPRLVKNCSTQQLVMWAAASGDFYQIHYDETFAKGTGLKDIIVHGALKNAFLGQLLHDWIAPGGQIVRYGCSYRGMDYPNQEIICRGIVKKKYQEGGKNLVELEIWTETGKANDDGRPKNPEGIKTTPGDAIVALPKR